VDVTLQMQYNYLY